MKFVEFLQGKWLGHPLHAAIVHVPVAGWLIACGLDLLAWGDRGPDYLPRLAFWCVAAGLVVALVAVPPGVADWSAIKKEKPAWKIALYHMLLNVAAVLVWCTNLGLRWAAREESAAAMTTPIVTTSLAGTLLVLVSAYLGTRLVFAHGIGVARTSKKKWREIAAHSGARLPEAKG